MAEQTNIYTFDVTKRYITAGINEQVPIVIQRLMWKMIDDAIAEGNIMDYLQIFDVSYDGLNFTITHKQEEPEYYHLYETTEKGLFPNPITLHIYVIDDVDHSTMLLAEEY